MKFSWNSVKAFASAALASGKKNAPTLMTAGSVAIGWMAVYIFWRQSKKAEAKIAEKIKERAANADFSEDEQRLYLTFTDIPRREKFTIYLQYCWSAAVLGMISSGLAIGANAINLSRIAELALAVQFMDQNGEKRKKLVDALKDKLGKSESEKIEAALCTAAYGDNDEIAEKLGEMIKNGDNRTLFVDELNGKIFPQSTQTVQDGIKRFNATMREMYAEKRDAAIYSWKRREEIHKYHADNKKRTNPWTDPFGVSKDGEYWPPDEEPPFDYRECEDIEAEIDYDVMLGTIYANGSVSDFVSRIGEPRVGHGTGIDEIAEFKCYSSEKDAFTWDDIARFLDKKGMEAYQKRFGEDVQLPQVCVLDYQDYLRPAYSLEERETRFC